ncbi:MAG: DUF3099 domain-containing protein [Candidatus Paceibacterota bacterium]
MGRADTKKESVLITTAPENTHKQRRKRYLQLMAVRVVALPLVLIAPFPVQLQIITITAVAIMQFGAVVGANTTAASDLSNKNLLPNGHAKQLV